MFVVSLPFSLARTRSLSCLSSLPSSLFFLASFRFPLPVLYPLRTTPPLPFILTLPEHCDTSLTQMDFLPIQPSDETAVALWRLIQQTIERNFNKQSTRAYARPSFSTRPVESGKSRTPTFPLSLQFLLAGPISQYGNTLSMPPPTDQSRLGIEQIQARCVCLHLLPKGQTARTKTNYDRHG